MSNLTQEHEFRRYFIEEFTQTSSCGAVNDIKLDDFEIDEFENENSLEDGWAYAQASVCFMGHEVWLSLRRREGKGWGEDADWQIENLAESWEDLTHEAFYFHILCDFARGLDSMEDELSKAKTRLQQERSRVGAARQVAERWENRAYDLGYALGDDNDDGFDDEEIEIEGDPVDG